MVGGGDAADRAAELKALKDATGIRKLLAAGVPGWGGARIGRCPGTPAMNVPAKSATAKSGTVQPGNAASAISTGMPARTSVTRDSLIFAFTCIWAGSGSRIRTCPSRTLAPASTTNSDDPPRLLATLAYTT